MTKSDRLLDINDRLADVLCTNKGFHLALKSHLGGNDESKKALIEYSEYIATKLTECKHNVHLLTNEELTQ